MSPNRVRAYYNENDPGAAAWLRNLILLGEITDGDVDERSIIDVRPSDLAGYTQCHFFAGIGGWPEALRLAGWPDDRPVWTGSCPCQPYSVAGKGKGDADSRHLFPAWHWLIGQCRPAVVFGEQVASKDGRGWLARVQLALEALGYRFGAADLCAAGVGAPHIRQRLYWVADTKCNAAEPGRLTAEPAKSAGASPTGSHAESGRRSSPRRLANTDGRDASSERLQRSRELGQQPEDGCTGSGLDDADRERRRERPARRQNANDAASASEDAWGGIYVPCADGKSRRIEPGLEPLANGVPGRVGLLRGFGNAIVPQLAATFIEACEEAVRDTA